MIRICLKIAEGGIVLFLLVLSLPILWGLKPYTVTSGSMEPTLHVGALVYVKKTSEVKEGDMIAFAMENGGVCIHRCMTCSQDGTYVTKGDANSFEDAVPVKEDQIIGRAVWTYPLAGYGAQLLKTPFGFGTIVLIFMGNMVLDMIPAFGRKDGRMSYEEKKDHDSKREKE